MTRHLLLTALLFLSACADERAVEPGGFSGLGTEVEGFAEVAPGYPFRFPADHGAHPDYRIEWWYVTANLKDDEGRDYGVQWTLFRQALWPGGEEEGWATPQLWMGHAAITSAADHSHAETFARGGIGQAGAEAAPFRAWIDDWRLQSRAPSPDGFAPLQMIARGDDFSYALELTTDRPLVFHGASGYSVKSEQGQASYYFSQPFFSVRGELQWRGETITVRGQGWLDREWSSQPLAPGQEGWDWFALHLDSGEKLMLFRLRETGAPAWYAGTWIAADGHARPLVRDEITMTPLNRTRIGERLLPARWRLQVPAKGFDIETEALNEEAWMATSIPYWEGPIRFSGSHSGRGFLEMTGY